MKEFQIKIKYSNNKARKPVNTLTFTGNTVEQINEEITRSQSV